MPLILGTNSIKDTAYEVANSLRFNRGSSDYLNRTFSSGNQQLWTWSSWIKRGNLGTFEFLFGNQLDGGTIGYIAFDSNNKLDLNNKVSSSTGGEGNSTMVFRDVSAWYHIVIVFKGSESSVNDRFEIYVNGVQDTYVSRNSGLSTGNGYVNSNINHGVGANASGSGFSHFDGYQAETVFIDGQALDPTSFGEFDSDTNIWKPKDVSGLTFGTNGFHLDFENSGSLGADVSGNSNNFTVNNLTSVDQSTDTCTNNFATLNFLQSALNGNTTIQTFSEGNLQVITPNTVYSKFGGASTIGASQGKWYAEIRVSASGGTYSTYQSIGITGDPSHNANITNTYIGGQSFSAGYYNQGGLIQVNNSTVFTYGTTESVPYDVMIAMDLDNNKVYFGIDGTWVNSGDPAGGTGGFTIPASSTVPTGNYFFATYSASSLMTSTYQANFGNPPFTISSGNSDANGYGNFEYAVPTGYYALNTKNLAEYG